MEQEEVGPRSQMDEIDVLSDSVLRRRYALNDFEDWNAIAERVGGWVAQAEENPEKRDVWSEKFTEAIRSMDFIPGGRTLRNAQRPYAQMLNCFVLGVDDNIENIGELAKDTLIVASGGGGIGINFSDLRPHGDHLVSKGGIASGPCSYMKMIDDIGATVETGGSRRIALIFLLNCDHPDIMKFIDLKREEGVITYANISVGITNEFVEAVRNDEDWDLVFGGRTYQTVKARDLWEKLVYANYNYGDPGIINLSTIDKYNNISYYTDIVATNPCGEIPIEQYGCCCLGNINLANMVRPPVLVDGDVVQWGEVDWNKLKETVEIGVRFLDNVLSVNHYPKVDGDRIRETCLASRRIGLGHMGIHYMLLDMGIEYGANEECLRFLDEIQRFIKETAYQVSCDLAEEKKPFPKFKQRHFLQSPFIQSLPEWLQDKIHRQGVRNCALLTIPPTGTTSQIPKVSPGVEPVYAPVYYRKARLTDGEEETRQFYVVDPKFRQMKEMGLPTKHFKSTHEMTVRDHLLVQATLQRHIDNSISKTINIPHDYPVGNLSDDMLHFADRVKGFTMWREGSREQAILTPAPKDEWDDALFDDMEEGTFCAIDCETCE